MPAEEPLAKPVFCPMAALPVGKKCSCTLSTLRFFTSARLALEQNLEFCKRLSCEKLLVFGSEIQER